MARMCLNRMVVVVGGSGSVGGGRDGRGRKQLSRQPTTAAVAAIGATAEEVVEL